MACLDFAIYTAGAYWGTVSVSGAARACRVVAVIDRDADGFDRISLAAIQSRLVVADSAVAVALWQSLTRQFRERVFDIEPELAIALDRACLASAEQSDADELAGADAHANAVDAYKR